MFNFRQNREVNGRHCFDVAIIFAVILGRVTYSADGWGQAPRTAKIAFSSIRNRNKLIRRFRNLSLAFLSCALLGLAVQLEAVEPVATVGKPPLIDLQYSPDGRFLATLVNSYVNPYVEFLDAETFVPVNHLDAADGTKLDFSHDGSLLAVFGSADIQIWEVDFQRLLATIPVKTEIAEFSPNGKYLAYAEKDSVSLWDISQRQTVRELTGDPQPKLKAFLTWYGDILSIQRPQRVEAIAFHPDSSVLAVGSIRSTVALWDIETREIRTYLNMGETMLPKRVQFSHDGMLLAASTSSGELKLWEVATGDLKYLRESQGTNIYDLVFTPDNQHLLMGGDEATLHPLQIETLQEESRPAVNRLPISGSSNNSRLERLTFLPSGMRFASQINHSRIAVWDAQSLSRLQTLYGWTQTLADAVYLQKLNRIVTGIYTNVLHFWDAQTGDLLNTVEFHRPIYHRSYALG